MSSQAVPLLQVWPLPTRPRPIVLIGAGGIVRQAHLPAYRRLGLPLAGVYDRDPAKAQSLGLERVFASLSEAAAAGSVFDVAVPADQIGPVLAALPEGAAVLCQKPFGQNLQEALALQALVQARRLILAVNFSLRFCPNMLALRDLLKQEALGPLVDADVRVVIDQPWQLWDFLKTAPRIEFLYHSIHYLDLLRHLLGEPQGVYAKGLSHPSLPGLADTRSSIILDYGERLRCSLVLDHTHRQGPRERRSHLMIEGLRGAALAKMGVNLSYPKGEADSLELALDGAEWQDLSLRGSWFNEGFEGPMCNLQRFIAGEDAALVSSVEDSVRTMALVEACYTSSAQGGTPIPSVGA